MDVKYPDIRFVNYDEEFKALLKSRRPRRKPPKGGRGLRAGKMERDAFIEPSIYIDLPEKCQARITYQDDNLILIK